MAKTVDQTELKNQLAKAAAGDVPEEKKKNGFRFNSIDAR